MADITLNSAVRSNLRTMQATTELMNRTEERLSTGKKVNSALDNPSNFFTAQSLERRAGDLGALLDSVATSVKTLEAADNGIKAINKLVEQMKSTARSAQQSPSGVEQRASFESAVIAGATAGNILGGTAQVGTAQVGTAQVGTAQVGTAQVGTGPTATTFDSAEAFGTTSAGDITINSQTVTLTAGMNFADFKAAAEDAVEGLTVTQDADTGVVSYSLASGEDLTIDGSAAQLISIGAIATGATDTSVGSTNGTEASSDYVAASSDYQAASSDFVAASSDFVAASSDYAAAVPGLSGSLTVSVGGASATTITFGTGEGEVSTLEGLNNALKGAGARATLSSDGKLTIETLNQNEADSLSIGGSLVSTDGTSADGEIFSFATSAGASKDATIGDSDRRVNYKNDYNDLLGQITELAKDASFNGVNLLAGDALKVVFNENGESFLDVNGVNILETLGLENIADEDFLDSSSIDAVINKLNDALNNLNSQASKFGSQLSVVQTRQSFTKDMIGTLEDGAYNLTGADTNTEAANLATLQTRQQLIVSALSISTSQEQNVLQLLR